jgi:hypothetical protein
VDANTAFKIYAVSVGDNPCSSPIHRAVFFSLSGAGISGSNCCNDLNFSHAIIPYFFYIYATSGLFRKDFLSPYAGTRVCADTATFVFRCKNIFIFGVLFIDPSAGSIPFPFVPVRLV